MDVEDRLLSGPLRDLFYCTFDSKVCSRYESFKTFIVYAVFNLSGGINDVGGYGPLIQMNDMNIIFIHELCNWDR